MLKIQEEVKFIDIGKEDGELIMQHMETALKFRGWNLLAAKYDGRFKNIIALFSREEDTDVHRYSFRMNEERRLIAYTHLQFSPEIFIEKFINNGYVFTVHEERLKRVFERVMTPELALQMVVAGMKFERIARGVR